MITDLSTLMVCILVFFIARWYFEFHAIRLKHEWEEEAGK